MAPVAKRNFCRRHDHGMSKLKDGKVPDDDGNQSDSTSGSKKGSAPDVIPGGPPQCLPVPKDTAKAKPQAPLDLLTSTATSQFLDSNDKKRKKPTVETKAGDEDKSDADAARAAAEGVSRNQSKPQTFKRVEKKVGRNEPCPCGSGKKYKHCHGRGRK